MNPKGGIKAKMKLLKSKKALSPVVAAIILIAVTVAVSIAVAAWMGAITFTFMGGAEQLTFTAYAWDTANSPPTYINITVKNTGSGKLTISDVRIGETSATWSVVVGSTTLDAGDSATIQVTGTFSSGTLYEFYVITASGNTFGPYSKRAP